MRKKRKINKKKAVGYGLIGASASPYVTGKVYTGVQQFRANRGVRKETIKEYWKKNPEAHRFYKHKRKVGDKRGAEALLKKIKKPSKKVDYFKASKQMMKNIDEGFKEYADQFTTKGKKFEGFESFMNRRLQRNLSADDMAFLRGKGMFNKKYLKPIVLGSAVAGAVYGATRPHKKPKKLTKKQAGIFFGGSALAGVGYGVYQDRDTWKKRTKGWRKTKKAVKLIGKYAR